MNAFHVLGGAFAAWALIVSFLGITRENFPSSKGAERAVMAISVTLWLCAVGSAIGTAIHEHNEEKGHEGGEHALTLPI
jgi:hypothetical protein